MYGPELYARFSQEARHHMIFYEHEVDEIRNSGLNFVIPWVDPENDKRYISGWIKTFIMILFPIAPVAGNPWLIAAIDEIQIIEFLSQVAGILVLPTLGLAILSNGKALRRYGMFFGAIFVGPTLWVGFTEMLAPIIYGLPVIGIVITVPAAVLVFINYRKMLEHYARYVAALPYGSPQVDTTIGKTEQKKALGLVVGSVLLMNLPYGVYIVVALLGVFIATYSRGQYREYKKGVRMLLLTWVRYYKCFIPVPGVYHDGTPNEWRSITVLGVTFFLFGVVISPAAAAVGRNMGPIESTGEAIFLSYLLALVLFGTVLVLGYAVLLIGGRPLLDVTKELEDTEQRAELAQKEGPVAWEVFSQKVMNSEQPREREHYFLGLQMTDMFPIYLHKSIVDEHGYIVGDTGSGKTALGVIPLMRQIIGYRESAVVIIDLKGDNAMLQTALQDAKASGAAFRLFTLEEGKKTNIFNIFGQKNIRGLSLLQQTEVLLESLALNHGDGYGKSFYSRTARSWLLRELKKHGDSIHSFKDLHNYMLQKNAFASEKDRENVSELYCVVEALAEVPQLNVVGRKLSNEAVRTQIHMPEVLENQEVVYFWLPAVIGAANVSEVAKLALYSLITAAYSRQQKAQEPRSVHVICDEFQRMAGGNFKLLLEQGRSLGVHFLLSNQTIAALGDGELRATVVSNTRWKLGFSASDVEQQEFFMKSSGEYFDGGTLEYPGRGWTPLIGRNDLIEMSDKMHAAIFQTTRGAGFTQFSGYPVLIVPMFAMSEKQYKRFQREPWPEDVPGTFVVNATSDEEQPQPPSGRLPRRLR